MLAAAWWARRRGEDLTPGRSWVAASIASSLAIAGAFALVAVRSPDRTFERFRQVAAAREAAPSPKPPAWLARAFPETTQPPDPLTQRVLKSRAFTVYFGVMGVGMAMAVLGVLTGSLGWAGTTLLTNALSRRFRA
jgi:hypothetical protein